MMVNNYGLPVHGIHDNNYRKPLSISTATQKFNHGRREWNLGIENLQNKYICML